MAREIDLSKADVDIAALLAQGARALEDAGMTTRRRHFAA